MSLERQEIRLERLGEHRLVGKLVSEAGIYALLPSRDQVPARVRVFLDELTRALADDPRPYAFAHRAPASAPGA